MYLSDLKQQDSRKGKNKVKSTLDIEIPQMCNFMAILDFIAAFADETTEIKEDTRNRKS